MHAMCSDLNIRYASVTDMLRDMEEFRKNPAIRFTFLPKGGSAPAPQNVVRIQPTKPQNTAARQKELEREYERQDREEKRRRAWMIAAITLAALALVGLLFLVLSQGGGGSTEQTTATSAPTETTLPKEVIVPPLIGSIYVDIPPEKYPYLHLVVNESSYVYDDNFPEGVICDQRPTVGERVPPNTEIFLYISLGEQTDAMPKLVGYTAENANNLLKALKIELTILTDKEFSDDVPEGRVTRSDPEQGTELKNGQVVTVYISQGPENKDVKVPNVLNASKENAQTSLEAHKLVMESSEDYSATVAAGYVISQNPEAGAEVPEGTTVKVVISKGKQTVTVPNVIGQTESEAADTLHSVNLQVKTETEYNSYVPAGQVIRQSPDANEEAMPGTEILLTLSLGPEPPPTTTEAPEPSSEPEESSSEESSSEEASSSSEDGEEP